MTMQSDQVRNYQRPVSLGGPTNPNPDEATIRWFGTACFELSFGDRVLLLDNYYERPPKNRSLGFATEDVVRADTILVGHPHHDHVADTVQVSQQTGARTVVHPIGADFLLANGLPSEKIVQVTGLGGGDLLDEGDFSVRVLHGYHMEVDLGSEQVAKWQALSKARAEFEAQFLPEATSEENARGAAIAQRGVHTAEVNTEATLTYVIEIDGFRIAYRDSGGAISAEELAYFAANPGVDVAILSINGLPHVASQLEEVFMPLVRLYQPKVLIPAHHDELWTNFDGSGLSKIFADVATEPIKDRVHEELPDTITAQPGLIEPLSVHRAKGEVTLGELRLR
jgi:L-ascorbate metabolism protein UlaG (beta-lactamase superfamily)